MRQLAIYDGTPVRSPVRFLVYRAPLIGETKIAEVADCMRRFAIIALPEKKHCLRLGEFSHEPSRNK